MVFNDENTSNLYIPVKGLVDKFEAGSCIEIINNVISVKLAENTHGLVAVDGALALTLATTDSDGAMSKEDKIALDALKSLDIANMYATKQEVQTVTERISNMEESYTWGEL
jgi:hypothetical protein